MSAQTMEDIERNYQNMLSELLPLLKDGWLRSPDEEREGFSVVAVRAAGDFRAKIVTNVHVYPEWMWNLQILGGRLHGGVGSTDNAAEAVVAAEESWRAKSEPLL